MTIASETAHTGGTAAAFPEPVAFTWKSADGLTLSGSDWAASPGTKPDGATAVTVLCLPGLSRNIRDFNDIARFLQSSGHRVVALDYRGRGKSDWDPDWQNYALTVEEKDIDAAIEQLGLKRFVVLGTSRGGLHALAMSNRYPPDRMVAVILNDIGPHIEMRAIHRIAATLGRHMKSATFEQVAGNLQRTIGSQFPGFGPDDWRKLASQLASHRSGEVVMDYDPALAHQLASLDDAAPVADLWHLYEKLTDRPVLIIHGEHSDLLSRETCQRMLELHPEAQLLTVAGQGHAPVLWEEQIHEKVAGFLKDL